MIDRFDHLVLTVRDIAASCALLKISNYTHEIN